MSCKDCIYFRPEELPEKFSGRVWKPYTVVPHWATNCQYKAEDGFGLCMGRGEARPMSLKPCGNNPCQNGTQLCCHKDAKSKLCPSFIPIHEQAEMFNH